MTGRKQERSVSTLPLPTADMPRLRESLSATGLPVDDLTQAGRRFFRFEAQGDIAGYGGVEGAGAELLLRSVIVMPKWRRRGVGQAIVRSLEAEARRTGCMRLHVLTTTASLFFQHASYAPTARVVAPPTIAATRQLASLCPANADYLVKQLEPVPN